MDLLDVFWYLTISYSAYLGRVGSETSCTDDTAQVLYLMLKERTFRYFGVYQMALQYHQGLSYMSHVRIQIPTIHKNVIQENDNEIIQMLRKDAVH